MSDGREIDPRMQVIIDLVPTEKPLFRVTYSDCLYWRPDSHGYTSEYNPFWAGFYEPSSHYAEYQYENRRSDHSYAVDARTRLSTISIPDDCLMAMLVDEVTRLRAALAAASDGEP